MAEEEKKEEINYSRAWGEAKEIMWRHRRRLALGLVLMLVSRLTGLVLPLSSKWVLDEVIGVNNLEMLNLIVWAVALATLVQAATSFALSQVLGVAAQRAIMEMRKTVQQHITRLPTSYFDNTRSGVLISRVMTDPEGVRNLVGTGLAQLTGGLVTASVGLCVLFWLNWKLTFVVISILSIFGFGMVYAFIWLRPVFRKRGEITAAVTGRLTESFGGIRVVKAYTAEKRESIIFAEGVHNLFRNIASTVTAVSAVGAFVGLIIGVNGTVIIWVGANAVVNESMSPGDFALYLICTALVAAPLVNVANIGTQISEAFAGLDRIREIRQVAVEGHVQGHVEPLEALRGDIAFENVEFEYEKGVPVLKGITFEAPAGSTTALVGSSGSGKSTLIGLVMAFHYPGSGLVTVDGRDITDIDLRDYRSRLGIVMQDNFLFEGTISDNIRYSTPHATQEAVLEASRIAHCDEFIQSFDDKHDTVVGERGIKLSGGQRQRVAIARAILANPRMLILDEATSSLDSESEAMIQDGLEALRRGRTTFVIAHRLSTIRSADQILVLEQGEIVERGPLDELVLLDGRYRQLYEKQYQAEMNRFINPGEEMETEDDDEA